MLDQLKNLDIKRVLIFLKCKLAFINKICLAQYVVLSKLAWNLYSSSVLHFLRMALLCTDVMFVCPLGVFEQFLASEIKPAYLTRLIWTILNWIFIIIIIVFSVRVKQVQCDSSAWPTCDPKAILLKRKFECHMLPTRCHEVNEDEIRKICPEEGILFNGYSIHYICIVFC